MMPTPNILMWMRDFQKKTRPHHTCISYKTISKIEILYTVYSTKMQLYKPNKYINNNVLKNTILLCRSLHTNTKKILHGYPKTTTTSKFDNLLQIHNPPRSQIMIFNPYISSIMNCLHLTNPSLFGILFWISFQMDSVLLALYYMSFVKYTMWPTREWQGAFNGSNACWYIYFWTYLSIMRVQKYTHYTYTKALRNIICLRVLELLHCETMETPYQLP